ncbi:docking protein 5-like [Sardina pilchardus]|uniref:docking protein 5-like n=1 Tax=Sardina pilchardus TaxID=27697 RepID=UPI002E10E230
MDSEFSDILKQSYVKIRRRHFWIYQRCWLVFKRASSKGPNRLEKFPNERASNFHCHQKVIDLKDVTDVTRPSKEKKKNGLVLTFADDSTLAFTCDSGGPVRVIFIVPSERFRVCLLPCKGLMTSGECVLQVGPEAISLWDSRNPSLKCASWPLTSLRRFGRDRTWFTFEAGRMCETGEGLVKFETMEGEAIYQRVRAAVQSIIKQQDCPLR